MISTRDRWNRPWPLLVILSVASAFLASGCLWGVVMDAETGGGVQGATVTYTDYAGRTFSTTIGDGGRYCLDDRKGEPVPSGGPTIFQVSAPGYEPLTVSRFIAYDDNSSSGGLWEVQHFSLVPLTGRIEVELMKVDLDKALLAPEDPVTTEYLVEFNVYDPANPTTPVCSHETGWFAIAAADPPPVGLNLECTVPGDDFSAEVTVVLERYWQEPSPPYQMFTETDTSTAAFEWIAPSPETYWKDALLDSTDAAGPDDADLEFEAEIAYRSVPQ